MKNTQETPQPAPQPEPQPAPQPAPQPVADPILMRQQALQQQYQQANGRIMELRQQETLVKDMITDATMAAAEIRGAMKELKLQQKG